MPFAQIWLVATQERLSFHPVGSLPLFLGGMEQLQGQKLSAADRKVSSQLALRLRKIVPSTRGRMITNQEQEQLRNSRVAVAAMGVGGIDLVTLARLGIGRSTIADQDVLDVANPNRQFGATCSTMGRSKVEVMAEIVRDINPQADVRVVIEPLGPENAEEFLRDANLFMKLLLAKGHVLIAPRYQQFDPYVGRLVRGWLPGGNRHPWQRFKRWMLTKRLREQQSSRSRPSQ